MIKKIKAGDHYITADISTKEKSPLNIIIAHGTNNDMNHRLITKLFGSLKKKYSTIRFNFSYVDMGLKQDDAINKDEIKACIDEFDNKNIVLIGKSYGGVLCSQIAEEGRYNILKLVILGYPLHEYKKPQVVQIKDGLDNIKIPIVFIIGDKDPNCNLDVFKRLLPNRELYIVVNADHSYRPIDGSTTIEENEGYVDRIIQKELGEVI